MTMRESPMDMDETALWNRLDGYLAVYVDSETAARAIRETVMEIVAARIAEIARLRERAEAHG